MSDLKTTSGLPGFNDAPKPAKTSTPAPAKTSTPAKAPAPAETSTPAPTMVKIRIMRDRWGELGDRQEKGRVIDLPLDETVLEGIENGTMERYKSPDGK